MRRDSWRSVPSDVEAAELLDLVVLGRDLRLDPLERRGPRRVVLLGVLDRVEALLAQLLVGEELRGATEHDVGASAGHVGGDGDRALVTGQGDDLGLVLVLLGVQHRCGTPRFFSRPDSSSDFSTEVVPTSTGCPSRCRSAMSSTTASNLASSVR